MKIPVYVISVRSFTDRHAHIESLALKYGFKFKYIWEHDTTEKDFPRWSGIISSDLAPKSVSNVLKHLEAQKKFLDIGAEIALILEDDVIFLDGFLERFQQVITLSEKLDNEWLIFLGGADNKIDPRFMGKKGMSLVNSWITTAEAYLIDRAGCEKRMKWLENHTIDRQADHLIKQMDEQLGITHFRVSIPLTTQGSITGKFKTQLDSSRQKHGQLFLRCRYEYNKFRRQTLPRLMYRLRNF